METVSTAHEVWASAATAITVFLLLTWLLTITIVGGFLTAWRSL